MKMCVVSAFAILGLVAPLAVGCNDSCFEESTLGRTPEGRAPIGELVVGDAVVSIDPSTGAEATTHVARVSYSWAWCEKLVVDGQAVWLTEEHPLYSPELSDFRPAESWLTDELHHTLREDGDPVATTGGSWLDQRPCRVVDLTVDAEPPAKAALAAKVGREARPAGVERACAFHAGQDPREVRTMLSEAFLEPLASPSEALGRVGSERAHQADCSSRDRSRQAEAASSIRTSRSSSPISTPALRSHAESRES